MSPRAAFAVAWRHLASRIKTAIWKLLLNKEVRPFIWLYYLPLWAWGVFGTFFEGPATYVLPIMGQAAYQLWVWTCFIGTTVVMIGLRLEEGNRGQNHARETSWRDYLAYMGLGQQCGGHACMFGVLLSFEICAIVAFRRGTDMDPFTLFAISPYVVGCLLLTLQTLAQLTATEILKNQEAQRRWWAGP